MKQILQKAQQHAFEPVIDALSPDKGVSGGVYVPTGITPAEYTANLQEGISYKIALLAKLLDEVQYDPGTKSAGYDGKVVNLKSGGKLTDDDAKRLTEAILSSSFMTQQPSVDVNSKALTPKAELALWLGWAWARDAEYWRTARQNQADYGASPGNDQGTAPAFWEQFEWWPVAVELISLGVPAPPGSSAALRQLPTKKLEGLRNGKEQTGTSIPRPIRLDRDLANEGYCGGATAGCLSLFTAAMVFFHSSRSFLVSNGAS